MAAPLWTPTPQRVADANITAFARRVESRHGAIEGVAELTRAVKPGHLFLPFAYWEAAANRLTGSALDPFGKIPGFKVTAVRAFAVPT